MLQHHDNLMNIRLTMSDNQFNIIIMSSLPESYWPILQMITAAERANKLSGMQANTINMDNLMAFIIKEARHHVINNDQTKSAESALEERQVKRKEKRQAEARCYL
jgi:hypothetical protein